MGTMKVSKFYSTKQHVNKAKDMLIYVYTDNESVISTYKQMHETIIHTIVIIYAFCHKRG